LWFTDEAIAAWRAEPRTTRGGQPHYSALAIANRADFASRVPAGAAADEGLIGSIIRLLGLDFFYM
jgi:hypothetical protein